MDYDFMIFVQKISINDVNKIIKLQRFFWKKIEEKIQKKINSGTMIFKMEQENSSK